MKRLIAILLALALVAVLWYTRRGGLQEPVPQAELARQVQGMGCTEVSCGPVDKVLAVPMDTRGTWSRFCEGIVRAYPMSAQPPACCVGTSDLGNVSICPLMVGARPEFDETWSLLLVHFGRDGVTTCRGAGARPGAEGGAGSLAHPATHKDIPWDRFSEAEDEWADWLGFRPEKHVLLFSMGDDCPLADHLPQLQSLFRDCERLGDELPKFRSLDGRLVLLNRGNAILLLRDIRTLLPAEQCEAR